MRRVQACTREVPDAALAQAESELLALKQGEGELMAEKENQKLKDQLRELVEAKQLAGQLRRALRAWPPPTLSRQLGLRR